MDADDFFDFSKPFQRLVISGGATNGRMSPKMSFETKDVIEPRQQYGNEYAIGIQIDEQKRLLETAALTKSVRKERKRMEEITDTEVTDIDEMGPRDGGKPLDIYKKYNFDHIVEKKLPIWKSRSEILKTLNDNPFVVLQGATGCGKTTQVPQFILDESKFRNEHCNIVVTQPRRIAALSIARRVCQERNWELGKLVGYQVGLHAKIDEDTRLLYCTTGVLLQKLITSKNIAQYTHIILDEIHERDSEMDFLMIVIRKLLYEPNNFGRVKVILMSATIDTFEFSNFFKFPRNGTFENAPIVTVDRRSPHTVSVFYLDDIAKKLKISYEDLVEPSITDEMYMAALKLILVCERLDLEDVNDSDSDPLPYKPSILIFLPGLYEIEKMYKNISRYLDEDAATKLSVLPLHSSITNEEQAKVFLPPANGYRKVILSTNIAESSITVPDIKYVIDFCLTKCLITDRETNFTTLKMEWASKNNCKQRSGRAGRVMNGRVYRLVSNKFYEFHMSESGIPEILRCPLENIVLKAKVLNMGPPYHILALAMTPPKLSDISNSVLVLKEVGALVRTDENDVFHPQDGDLTYVGRVMSCLPLDVRVSKLIILGYALNVMEETIIMAAGLTVRNIFATPFNRRLPAYSQKLDWANGSASDLFAIMYAYKTWKHRVEQRLFDSEETEHVWANRYFIQIRAMREMDYQIFDIKKRLQHCNLTEIRSNENIHWSEREKPIILKIAICGAFYPHYFRVRKIDERDAFQVLSGRDPYNTVYLKGMHPKYVGMLYENEMKKFLAPICGPKDLKISFDMNSERTFVTFVNSDKYIDTGSSRNNHSVQSVPGRVVTEVYKAVRMGKLEPKNPIQVLPPAEAVEYARNRNLGEERNGVWYPLKRGKQIFNSVIPPLHVKEMSGTVQNVVHCNKFWFQPQITLCILETIEEKLRPEFLLPFVNPSDINIGELVAAPFSLNESKDLSYFRARVLGFCKKVDMDVFFTVFYIDYGNSSDVKFRDLRKLDEQVSNLKEVPPCIFPCTLTGVQPSCINSPREIWTRAAVQELVTFTKSPVIAEIYSYTNRVASVSLHQDGECINDILIKKGYAQPVEENYMSKTNHDVRVRKQELYKMNSDNNDSMNDDEFNEVIDDDDTEVVDAPPHRLCCVKLNLTGPFNPLETSIDPLIKFGQSYRCITEENSVNSIIMHSDPDCGNRLVVAASITAKKQNQSITAWCTTVMPSIKGFDALMAMLFAPTIELNRDANNARYSSILCGLGYNPKTKQPYFEEHDVLIHLDSEITVEDLENINQLRYSITSLLYTDGDEEVPMVQERTKIKILQKIKTILVEMLQRPRRAIELILNSNDFKWAKAPKEDLWPVANIFGYRALYPPHQPVSLQSPKERDLERLRKNCNELYDLAVIDRVLHKPFDCKLCNITMERVAEVRMHMYTALHRSREIDIGFENKK